jgi:uncharacterized membrane protein
MLGVDAASSARGITLKTEPLSSTAKKNIETIALVEQTLIGRQTGKDRIGAAIARFFGTFRFIVAHVVFFALWFVLNSGTVSGTVVFDPYPYPFLSLIVGIEFIFLTTFILMNQSHQSRRDEQWAHLNLQLAMLAEHEITKNLQMLQRICKHLGLEQATADDEIKELAQKTAVTTLAEEIAIKLGRKTSAAHGSERRE